MALLQRQAERDVAAQQWKQSFEQKAELARLKREIDEKNVNLNTKRVILHGIDLISKGKSTDIDGSPMDYNTLVNSIFPPEGGIKFPPGWRPKSTAENIADEVAKATGVTRATEAEKQPNRIGLAYTQGDIAAQKQANQQVFTAEQNELNRKAAMDRALLHYQGTMAKANATKAEKEEAVQGAINAFGPDVFAGRTTLDQINKMAHTGQDSLKMQTAFKQAGTKLLSDKNVEQIKSTNNFWSIIDKVHQLNALLQRGNPLTQGFQAKGSALQEEINADLGPFVKTAKEEKGSLSNTDISRAQGNIPQILPGSAMKSALAWNEN